MFSIKFEIRKLLNHSLSKSCKTLYIKQADGMGNKLYRQKLYYFEQRFETNDLDLLCHPGLISYYINFES